MATSSGELCPECGHQPRVVVAVAHPGMRSLIVDLLARQHRAWAVAAVDGAAELIAAMASPPDVLVMDAADFTHRGGRPVSFPVQHILVMGPEPDSAYRRATLDQGAGGWMSRDDVGDELTSMIRRVLGCPPQGPGPPPARHSNAEAREVAP